MMLPIKTLITALLITGSALALPEPAPIDAVQNVARDASADVEAVAEPVSLDKRACKCAKVTNPGTCSTPETGLIANRRQASIAVTVGSVIMAAMWFSLDERINMCTRATNRVAVRITARETVVPIGMDHVMAVIADRRELVTDETERVCRPQSAESSDGSFFADSIALS